MIRTKLVQQLPAATIVMELSEGNEQIMPISLLVPIALSAAATALLRVTVIDTQASVTIWDVTKSITVAAGTSITLNGHPSTAGPDAAGVLGEGIVVPIPEIMRGGDTITISAAVSAGAATIDAAVLRMLVQK